MKKIYNSPEISIISFENVSSVANLINNGSNPTGTTNSVGVYKRSVTFSQLP